MFEGIAAGFNFVFWALGWLIGAGIAGCIIIVILFVGVVCWAAVAEWAGMPIDLSRYVGPVSEN